MKEGLFSRNASCSGSQCRGVRDVSAECGDLDVEVVGRGGMPVAYG